MIRKGTYEIDLGIGCHVTVHAPRDRSVTEIFPQIEQLVREGDADAREKAVGRASSDAA